MQLISKRFVQRKGFQLSQQPNNSLADSEHLPF
jgi:hypothetical protein